MAAIVLAFVSVLHSAPVVAVQGSSQPGRTGSVAGAPSSTELVENPKEWDGKRIAFTGEAIGEIMVRGPYAWIHLNDDIYARANLEEGTALAGYNSGQAVWLPAELGTTISNYGNYKHGGDLVEVQGVFNAACAQHGGDMDIHADSLTVVQLGHVVNHSIAPAKMLLAGGLAIVAVALWWATRRVVRPTG